MKRTHTVYVATDGNDKWSGSRATPNKDHTVGPFATLTNAILAVRGMPKRIRSGKVRVLLRDGIYRLHKPVVLSPADSGTASCPLEIAAYKKETPVLDCGRAVELNMLPTPYTFWSNALAPVRRIDKRGRIDFAPFPIHRPEVLKAIPYRIENVLSGVLEAGQWFLDHIHGKLYLWPPDNADPNESEIIAPFLREALILAGDKKRYVRWISIRGIAFAHTNARRNEGYGAAGAAVLLSDVDKCVVKQCTFFGTSANALAVTGHAHHITIDRNEIADCGGGGVICSGGLSLPTAPNAFNRICNNHVHHSGRIHWHSPAIALMSEQSVIANNLIHDMPYIGISSGGVRHTNFANWPRPNKKLADAWKQFGKGAPTINTVKKLIPGHNRIEHNIVHHVMKLLHDGAAIYCHAGHHNIVRHNLVYGTMTDSSHGLYFDDEETDSLMEYNIVHRCPWRTDSDRGSSLHMHHNARNTVRNNMFIGPNRIFTIPNGYGGHRLTRNIFVFGDACDVPSDPAPVHGPGDGRRQPDWDAGPSIMDNNLYWSSAGVKPVREFLKRWKEKGYAGRSAASNPLFLGNLGEEFRSSKRSPAFRLGFKPISLENLGPKTKTTMRLSRG